MVDVAATSPASSKRTSLTPAIGSSIAGRRSRQRKSQR
jgi:hypothetical protein